MAEFVQSGAAVDFTPDAPVAAGEIIVIGSFIGIAKHDIAANSLGALAVEGVFDFAKHSGGGVLFAFGEYGFWDEANKVVVRTDAGGANELLGYIVQDADDDDDTVRLLLAPARSGSNSSSSSSSGA